MLAGERTRRSRAPTWITLGNHTRLPLPFTVIHVQGEEDRSGGGGVEDQEAGGGGDDESDDEGEAEDDGEVQGLAEVFGYPARQAEECHEGHEGQGKEREYGVCGFRRLDLFHRVGRGDFITT